MCGFRCEVGDAESTAFDGAFVEDDGVFYVISSVGHNGDNNVFTARVFTISECVIVEGLCNRSLTIVK